MEEKPQMGFRSILDSHTGGIDSGGGEVGQRRFTISIEKEICMGEE